MDVEHVGVPGAELLLVEVAAAAKDEADEELFPGVAAEWPRRTVEQSGRLWSTRGTSSDDAEKVRRSSEARINDIEMEYGEKSEEFERKLNESADWKKFGTSQTVGLAAGAVMLPVAGPSTSFGVAYAVPLVVDAATGGMETKIGIDIDRAVAEQEA